MPSKIYPLVCDQGIQRDGTKSASKKWTDGQWMRFQRGLPRAIGGWVRVQPTLSYYSKALNDSNFTVGQYSWDGNAMDKLSKVLTWDPYLKYQPRGIIVVNHENDQYMVLVGCVPSDNSYAFNRVDISSTTPNYGNASIYFNPIINSSWTLPMPLDYKYTFSTTTTTIQKAASSGVAAFLLNGDGQILPMGNYIYSQNLFYQNLAGIGPYIAYYKPNYSRWVFAESFCGIIPTKNIVRNSTTSTNVSFSQGSNGSNTLFAIPLYNLYSIQTTYVTDTFTVSANTYNITNYIKVFPIVYVTSLQSKSVDMEFYNQKLTSNIQPLYQLSHSGNPTGAGQGRSGYVLNYDHYGDPFVLPSSTQNGFTGTGQQYFPDFTSPNPSTGYIWSTDSVFCSGGVLDMAPFIFFYNYHPFDWDKNEPSSTNGYIAYTYQNTEIWTTDATPVKATKPIMVSGGTGIVSKEGGTTIIQEFVQVANTNIVYGAQIRGGSQSPAALFWSLDSVIKCSYIGGAIPFQFDCIASNLSILSSSCVVEVGGIFYWIGIDQFYFYNGTIQTLNNDTNINFFFENVDTSNAQKVWGVKVGQFNEIWWHWPNINLPNYTGECNAVLIYNYTQGKECWYDSAFPVDVVSQQAGRVCGTDISIFRYPIWIDAYQKKDYTPKSTATGSNYYFMWLHENTNDMNFPGLTITNVYQAIDTTLPDVRLPIETFITSRQISLPAVGPDNNWGGADKWLRLTRIEPDMNQTCDVNFDIYSKKYSADSDPTLPNQSYLILANDYQGVCYNQMVLYNGLNIGTNLIINGKYSVSGVAKFPYPRLITIINNSFIGINGVFPLSSLIIRLEGSYKGAFTNESMTIPNDNSQISEIFVSKLLYDSITKVTVLFAGYNFTTPPYVNVNISVGAKIPPISLTTNQPLDESERLKNFYTDINVQARIFNIRFYQYLLDSDFEVGQFLLHFDIGDGRQ